jgi:hypothetical protein
LRAERGTYPDQGDEATSWFESPTKIAMRRKSTMNRDKAQEEVINIGISYFQEWISDFETTGLAMNSILEQIKAHASISRSMGPGSWKAKEEAINVALRELSISELDQILERYNSINPETMGGSKVFFERLHITVRARINEARQRNSQK